MSLAEKRKNFTNDTGIELTPDQYQEEYNTAFAKIRMGLNAKGIDVSSLSNEELADFVGKYYDEEI